MLLPMLLLLITAQAKADSKRTIASVIEMTAIKHGVDPKLALAIAKTESGLNPKAVGASHGEVGLFQLHPRYFPQATFDVQQNVELGVKYLADLKKRKKSTHGCSYFVFYNIGPNRKVKDLKQTRYFQRVSSLYPQYCKGAV